MKLGLGTAQFGMAYGVGNRSRQVPAAVAGEILHQARRAGMRVFDTAADYGDAEEVLGASLPEDGTERIVTKLPRLPSGLSGAAEISSWVESRFAHSLRRLRRERIAALLVHHAADLLGPAGNLLYEGMSALRRAGRLDAIGVSVYEAREVDSLLERYRLDLVQVPVNVLDQRLIRGGYLGRLERSGVEIHGRTILLQGLLAMQDGELPSPYFEPWRPHLESFREASRAAGLSPLEAAVGFINTVPELHCGVIGVTTTMELEEVLNAAQSTLAPEWYASMAIDDRALLNPSEWRL